MRSTLQKEIKGKRATVAATGEGTNVDTNESQFLHTPSLCVCVYLVDSLSLRSCFPFVTFFLLFGGTHTHTSFVSIYFERALSLSLSHFRNLVLIVVRTRRTRPSLNTPNRGCDCCFSLRSFSALCMFFCL